MAERCDVIVVGARCAGSPLAAQLAAAGLKVVVLDRAHFPSDTLSTHVFQSEGIASLQRLGVLDRLVATAAPFMEQAIMGIEDMRATVAVPRRPGDVGTNMCVRRPVLDLLLIETAAEAGADVRTGTRVTGLIDEHGRVAGVRARSEGGDDFELRAPLVVGADGRGSTIGRLVGARKYNETTSDRFAYWAYYEGASPPKPPSLTFWRWGDDMVLAAEADAGVYMVIAIPPKTILEEFRRDTDASFDRYAKNADPVAEALAGATRIGPLRSVAAMDGFLRESSGPGWVLVGDAGHFKDPTPGQGITDAFRQVDQLAPAVLGALSGGPAAIDAATAAWWRWRDEDAKEKYWFAHDLGSGGRLPAPLIEIIRSWIGKPGGLESFLNIFQHRIAPSKVLKPSALLGATARLLRRGDVPRRALLAETRGLIATQVKRQRLNRKPVFGDANTEDPQPVAP